MAQQLRNEGQQVGLLVMIDAEAPPSLDQRLRVSPALAAAYLCNVAWWIVDDDFFRSAPKEKMARIRSRARLARARLVSLVRKDAGSTPDIRDALGVWRFPDSYRPFLEAHSRALANYRPREYSGPITLLRARTFPLSRPFEPDLGWTRLARGGLDVRVIAGAHDTVLTEPRVRALAAELRFFLDRAHRNALT
jgi:thioesterase domain-containing protein